MKRFVFLSYRDIKTDVDEIFWMCSLPTERKMNDYVFLLEDNDGYITITPIYYNRKLLRIKAVFVNLIILPLLWITSRTGFIKVRESLNAFRYVEQNGLENSVDVIRSNCQAYEVESTMDFYTKAKSYLADAMEHRQ